MCASEKPVNGSVPAVCLVMPVAILPQQLRMKRSEVMNGQSQVMDRWSTRAKTRTVRHAVIETFDSSQSPDFTPKVFRNPPQKLQCMPPKEMNEIVGRT